MRNHKDIIGYMYVDAEQNIREQIAQDISRHCRMKCHWRIDSDLAWERASSRGTTQGVYSPMGVAMYPDDPNFEPGGFVCKRCEELIAIARGQR